MKNVIGGELEKLPPLRPIVMPKISAIFWDVGGVLLTNGWDHHLRRRAADKFALDWDEFERRHVSSARDFETGRLSLDDYLRRTVFHDPRPFDEQAYKQFMFDSSSVLSGLEMLKQVASSGSYLLGMLNNESLELNNDRIAKFGLRDYFDVYFSSCYVGFWKPDPEIYRLALNVTQREPAECVFIDDRALNVEAAQQLGICGILYESPEQLCVELETLGILFGS
jgi:putative hydrolase of the HAD superfamily